MWAVGVVVVAHSIMIGNYPRYGTINRGANSATEWSTTYPSGDTVIISSVAPGTLRARVVPFGVDPAADWTSHYPLAQPQSATPPALAVSMEEHGWHISQEGVKGLVAYVSTTSPVYNISRQDGTLLTSQLHPPALVNGTECGETVGGPLTGGMWPECPGCCLRATLSLAPEEEIFGGGVQLYSGPALRGSTLFLRTNALVGQYPGWSHVVAPFFLSSSGYGFLLNTHGLSFHDIGLTVPGPPPPGVTCGTTFSDPASGRSIEPLVLQCPGAGKISKINFADYGLSTGLCGSFAESQKCTINQTANLTRLCVGRPTCTIEKVSNDWAGGDPCPGNNQKHLSVSALCDPVIPWPESGLGELRTHVADPISDVYFFAGPHMHDTLGQFSALAGRMSMPPKWALGLWYHPEEKSNQSVVVDVVDQFAAGKVNLSALTLEPPWQTHAYPCTYVWNPANFWDVTRFMSELGDRGVKLTLWEHAYVQNSTSSPLYMPLLENHLVSDWETWGGLTPDFALDDTRSAFTQYHTDTFIKAGVAGFKLDECDGNPSKIDPGSGKSERWFFPDDARFPSGLSGARMHNIFGALYGQTFHEMFAAAGLRTFLKARAMYVGSQRFPTTFYSDSYDYENYVLGVVNSGWGGWVWAPEVRQAKGMSDFCRRSQLMLFSALSSMDGWNTGFKPFPPDVDATSSAMFVRLVATRASLQPFLYSAWNRQNQTGIPVARALAVDFDSDRRTYYVDNQFLLGDGLMVAPGGVNETNRSVYFPDGVDWIDFWNSSGPAFKGGSSVTLQTPMTHIPVFQRKGSILMFNGGDHVVLRTTSNGRNSSTILYDDDGYSTRAHTHNESFATKLSVGFSETAESTVITLSATPMRQQWKPKWGSNIIWEVHSHNTMDAFVSCKDTTNAVLQQSSSSGSPSVRWLNDDTRLKIDVKWPVSVSLTAVTCTVKQ